ncbi:unnamed protein product, partial [Mesorhabditis belari]|uniref:UNC93-like protein MFSD11 n=1 Tax=Mesorhabditis belari TaxID=2138241 RepID=A0AAF3EW31_9BILA
MKDDTQCLLYIVYTFGNLIAPVVLHKLGTKRTLFVAVFCFAIYSSNFILIRNYIYFPACAFAGFGTALFFCSTGAYISKHSTEKTLSRNQALSFMLMGSSMLVSGNFMIISSEISKEPQQENLTQSEKIPELIFQGLKTPGMIKLVPLYFFCGMFTAFMNSIYTTSVSFTHSLAGYTNLIAFVCMSVSAGELIAFFYYLSSILTIYWLMGILFATLIASLFMFFWFLRDLRLERERLEELGEEKEKEKENENEKEKEKENEEEKENEKEKHFDKPIEN